VKSAIFNVTAVVCTTVPLTPWIVNVEVVGGVTPEVLIVNVDVPVLPVIVAGLKAAVAPAGRPVTVNATSPVSPFSAVLLTEYVVLPPTATTCVPGVADKANTGTAFTMTVAFVVWVRLPLVPVMVIG
jgi:hypothetical protein